MHFRTKQIGTENLFGDLAPMGKTIPRGRGDRLYSQGDAATAVFYVQRGYVKLTVVSRHGKEAVVGVLGRGSFFGHACLSGQDVRESTVTPVCDCAVIKIERGEMARALEENSQFCRAFLSHLLSRNGQLEADLADQLSSSCEMRLARALLDLAEMDAKAGSTQLLSRIDQQTLAGIVGTTQPRISTMLSRFKRQGFIGYETGLQVNSGLTNLISLGRETSKCANA